MNDLETKEYNLLAPHYEQRKQNVTPVAYNTNVRKYEIRVPGGMCRKRRPKNEDRRPCGLNRRPRGLKRRPTGLKRRTCDLKRRPCGLKRRPTGLIAVAHKLKCHLRARQT